MYYEIIVNNNINIETMLVNIDVFIGLFTHSWQIMFQLHFILYLARGKTE